MNEQNQALTTHQETPSAQTSQNKKALNIQSRKPKRQLPLTEKARQFVEHFVLTNNASESVRLAGYSRSGASVQGTRLLQDNRIKALIAQKRAQIERSTNPSKEQAAMEAFKVYTENPKNQIGMRAFELYCDIMNFRKKDDDLKRQSIFQDIVKELSLNKSENLKSDENNRTEKIDDEAQAINNNELVLNTQLEQSVTQSIL